MYTTTMYKLSMYTTTMYRLTMYNTTCWNNNNVPEPTLTETNHSQALWCNISTPCPASHLSQSITSCRLPPDGLLLPSHFSQTFPSTSPSYSLCPTHLDSQSLWLQANMDNSLSKCSIFSRLPVVVVILATDFVVVVKLMETSQVTSSVRSLKCHPGDIFSE